MDSNLQPEPAIQPSIGVNLQQTPTKRAGPKLLVKTPYIARPVAGSVVSPKAAVVPSKGSATAVGLTPFVGVDNAMMMPEGEQPKGGVVVSLQQLVTPQAAAKPGVSVVRPAVTIALTPQQLMAAGNATAVTMAMPSQQLANPAVQSSLQLQTPVNMIRSQMTKTDFDLPVQSTLMKPTMRPAISPGSGPQTPATMATVMLRPQVLNAVQLSPRAKILQANMTNSLQQQVRLVRASSPTASSASYQTVQLSLSEAMSLNLLPSGQKSVNLVNPQSAVLSNPGGVSQIRLLVPPQMTAGSGAGSTAHINTYSLPVGTSLVAPLRVQSPISTSSRMSAAVTLASSTSVPFSSTSPSGTTTLLSGGLPSQTLTLPPGVRSQTITLPAGATVRPQTITIPTGSTAVRPQTFTLPPGSTTIRPQTITLPPGSTTVRPHTITLPPGSLRPQTFTLPPGSITLPPGTTTVRPQTITLPPGSASAVRTQTIPLPTGATAVRQQTIILPLGSKVLSAAGARPQTFTLLPSSSSVGMKSPTFGLSSVSSLPSHGAAPFSLPVKPAVLPPSSLPVLHPPLTNQAGKPETNSPAANDTVAMNPMNLPPDGLSSNIPTLTTVATSSGKTSPTMEGSAGLTPAAGGGVVVSVASVPAVTAPALPPSHLTAITLSIDNMPSSRTTPPGVQSTILPMVDGAQMTTLRMTNITEASTGLTPTTPVNSFGVVKTSGFAPVSVPSSCSEPDAMNKPTDNYNTTSQGSVTEITQQSSSSKLQHLTALSTLADVAISTTPSTHMLSSALQTHLQTNEQTVPPTLRVNQYVDHKHQTPVMSITSQSSESPGVNRSLQAAVTSSSGMITHQSLPLSSAHQESSETSTTVLPSREVTSFVKKTSDGRVQYEFVIK